MVVVRESSPLSAKILPVQIEKRPSYLGQCGIRKCTALEDAFVASAGDLGIDMLLILLFNAM